MKNKDKIVKAIAIGGTAAGLIVGGLGGALLFPKEVNNVIKVPYEVQVEVEKIVNQTVEVPVEVIKEVETIVEVDNGNLQYVLEHIYDKDGNVEYLLDDLKESELDKIVDRIIFINDIDSLSLDYVKANLAEEIHREIVNGTKLYKADVERIRLDKDVSFESISFKYKDAIVKVTGSFRHDGDWYNFVSEVEIESNKIEDFKVISIEED